MDTNSIITQIDSEIERLQQARKALAAFSTAAPAKRRGRPPKNPAPAAPLAVKRRTLSAAARAKIAAAQKKRWAAQKKSASKA